MVQEQKVLRTAANGMRVGVPVDRLAAWEKAQADQSPEAEEAAKSLSSSLMSKLSELRRQVQQG